MSMFSWLGLGRTGPRSGRAGGPPRRNCKLRIEVLEDRSVPASFSVATVPELIDAMNASNLTPEADTIMLAPATKFTLTQVNNSSHGGNGLPVIAANENLTIIGNGATIERSTSGTASFRLFDVAVGASLRLENLTLQGGNAKGVALGGAIYSAGTLNLHDVIVQNNIAQVASFGGQAQGGGIYSTGELHVEGGAIRNNQAIGGKGRPRIPNRLVPGAYFPAIDGGQGRGGGVYVAEGAATLTDVSLTGNIARGGDRGAGPRAGSAFGGALYVSGWEGHATATLIHVTVSGNSAQAGGGGGGTGAGGGLYGQSVATALVLDAFTVAHVTGNNPDNIYGPYTLV